MRLSHITALCILTPLIVVGAAGCGDDTPAEDDTQPVAGSGGATGGSGGATGGSGGVTAGSGGAMAGSGGAATGGTGGAATGGTGGAATGGTGGAATGGTGGAATGGTGGTSTGGTSSGGTGGASVGPFACQGLVPTDALITDFTTVTTAGAFVSPGGFAGDVFTYPDTMTVTMSPALSMQGTVGNYTGFGLFFSQCLDASAYSGISFTIGGNVGTPTTLMLQAKMNSTTPISAATQSGACVATDPTNTYADCWDPVAWVTVPAAAATVTVSWADFSGGKPVATADPSEILGFQWSFNWAGETGVPYPVDVTIDDIAFAP